MMLPSPSSQYQYSDQQSNWSFSSSASNAHSTGSLSSLLNPTASSTSMASGYSGSTRPQPAAINTYTSSYAPISRGPHSAGPVSPDNRPISAFWAGWRRYSRSATPPTGTHRSSHASLHQKTTPSMPMRLGRASMGCLCIPTALRLGGRLEPPLSCRGRAPPALARFATTWVLPRNMGSTRPRLSAQSWTQSSCARSGCLWEAPRLHSTTSPPLRLLNSCVLTPATTLLTICWTVHALYGTGSQGATRGMRQWLRLGAGAHWHQG